MKYSNEKFYSCYSPNQTEYLKVNGFKVVETFVNCKTGKTCWVFDKTPEIAVYLEQWSKNRSSVNNLSISPNSL